MANYDIPQYPMKRLRYFTNQFLNEQDFIDDQAAHLAHERAQLRALCVAGVCEGLAVTLDSVTRLLSVAPGVAVDKLGRLIALDASASGPAPGALATGDYVLHLSYLEAPTDLSTNTGGTAGVVGNTRWHSEPVIAPTAKGTALPDGAVALGSFSVANGAIIASSVTTAGRQYSGLRLPGPNPTVAATLTNPNDGSADGAVLRGTLTVRCDVAAAIGPSLTLTNASSYPGTASAYGAIDFNPYDPGTNAPALRIQAVGDANGSSHLAVLTKAPGSVTAALVERLRVTSDGAVQLTGGLTAPTLMVTGASLLATQGGNVGIGLTNPDVKLHVSGNDPANVMARVENTSTTGSARLQVYGNANTLYSSFLQVNANGNAGNLAGGSIIFTDGLGGSSAAIKVRTSATASDKGTITLVAGGQGVQGMDGQLTIQPSGDVAVTGVLTAGGGVTAPNAMVNGPLSVIGATTLQSTLAVTGNVTSDVMLVQDKHVIVSGNGRFKHGIKTINVPVFPANAPQSASAGQTFGGTTNVFLPVTGVPVGARVRAVRAKINIGSSNSVIMTFLKKVMIDLTAPTWGEVVNSGPIAAAAVPPPVSVTFSYDVPPNSEMQIKVSGTGSGLIHTLYIVELDYEQP